MCKLIDLILNSSLDIAFSNSEAGNNDLEGGDGTDQLADADGNGFAAFFGSNIDASSYTLSPVTTVGSSGNDTLMGGYHGKLIIGGAGRDSIDGSAEADSDNSFGGASADSIQSDDGTDIILGGARPDLIDGDAGNDTLFGCTGGANIAGGTGVDQLTVAERADTFSGLEGLAPFGATHLTPRTIQIRLPYTQTSMLRRNEKLFLSAKKKSTPPSRVHCYRRCWNFDVLLPATQSIQLTLAA